MNNGIKAWRIDAPNPGKFPPPQNLDQTIRGVIFMERNSYEIRFASQSPDLMTVIELPFFEFLIAAVRLPLSSTADQRFGRRQSGVIQSQLMYGTVDSRLCRLHATAAQIFLQRTADGTTVSAHYGWKWRLHADGWQKPVYRTLPDGSQPLHGPGAVCPLPVRPI